MTVEVAIAVLISVTVILILLFYSVTRYFNYRLRRSLENQNQVYSMVDGMQIRKDEVEQADSEDFANNKFEQWNQRKFLENKPVFIPMAELNDSDNLRQSLSNSGQSIYERSRGQRKESFSIPILQQSLRSNSNQSFSVQKLESFRSIQSQKQNQGSVLSKDKNQTTHRYIYRLISYINQGISIIDNEVTQIQKNKQDSTIKQKKKVTKRFVSRNDDDFYDTLQAYGFQFDIKGAYKYEKTLKIPKMKPNIPYSVSELKAMDSKHQIQIQQFNILKNRLQQE